MKYAPFSITDPINRHADRLVSKLDSTRRAAFPSGTSIVTDDNRWIPPWVSRNYRRIERARTNLLTTAHRTARNA